MTEENTGAQAPTPGPLTVEITYEVYQDGDFCASSTHLQDAEHYANLYGQDGPVKCQTVVSVRHDDFLLSGDARLAPTAPVEASGSELKADFVRSHPSGMDDSTYEKIEDALDRADAPITGPDGKFLTLAQRVAALRPQPSGETREHGPKCWGKTSASDEMAHCYCGSEDSPQLREAVLKGVGKINGDGWKDTTTEGEVVFVWNAEKPTPYAPGQYPRVGNEGWSASTSQYDFTPATAKDVPAILTLLSARPLALGGQHSTATDFPPDDVLACDTTPARAEAQDEGAAGEPVALAECPPGLFLWNGTLGFKSEYGAMEPIGSNFKTWKVGSRADAYCADSGEYFWGGTSNHADRDKVLVMPIDAVSAHPSPTPAAAQSPEAWTPGRHLHALRMAFFNGGGWAEAPEWTDYDDAGHAKWEDFAKSVAAIDHSSTTPAADAGVLLPEVMTEEMERVWRGAFIHQGHKRHGRGAIGNSRRLKNPESCEQYAWRALRKHLLAALKSTAAKEGGE